MYEEPSSLGAAVICTLAASDPASGSVSAKAHSLEPSYSPGSHFACCSFVPNRHSARTPMLWCALTNTATLASCPPRTSIVLRYCCCPNPRPPYAVGIVSLYSPMSASP